MTCMPDIRAFQPSRAISVADPAPLAESPQAGLRRPRLLIRAARAGQASWRRDRDLPRLLAMGALPSAPVVLALLRDEEARLDALRRVGADYPVERHVAVLIALLAELTAAAAAVCGPDADGLPGASVVPFRQAALRRGSAWAMRK